MLWLYHTRYYVPETWDRRREKNFNTSLYSKEAVILRLVATINWQFNHYSQSSIVFITYVPAPGSRHDNPPFCSVTHTVVGIVSPRQGCGAWYASISRSNTLVLFSINALCNVYGGNVYISKPLSPKECARALSVTRSVCSSSGPTERFFLQIGGK